MSFNNKTPLIFVYNLHNRYIKLKKSSFNILKYQTFWEYIAKIFLWEYLLVQWVEYCFFMFLSLYSDLFKPANASLQEQHVEFSMIYVMCVITFSKIHSKMFKTRRYAMFCLYKCIPMTKCPNITFVQVKESINAAQIVISRCIQIWLPWQETGKLRRALSKT